MDEYSNQFSRVKQVQSSEYYNRFDTENGILEIHLSKHKIGNDSISIVEGSLGDKTLKTN